MPMRCIDREAKVRKERKGGHPSCSRPAGPGAAGHPGFALIVVLWGLVLVGLLIGHLVAMGRSQSRIAGNEIAAQQAAAAADGAVHVAIYHLMQTGEGLRWQPDGKTHSLTIGEASVAVTAKDQAGLVNPNLADDTLLAALFREAGAGQAQAAALTTAVISWRDPAAAGQVGGIGPMDYRAAGKDYGPPGAPFEDVGELGRVLGMTPPLLATLEPHLSLWNGLEHPKPDLADPMVARAMAQAGLAGERAPMIVQASRITVTIRAEAHAGNGARFVRRAVVGIGPGPQKGFKLLAWEQVMD